MFFDLSANKTYTDQLELKNSIFNALKIFYNCKLFITNTVIKYENAQV
jgi:hypothetical protein